ncbi:hypothetical protein FRB90_010988 [Tulasnella sp. 427]|nr:hypothetical protein FRB90_010988 [Tulasnella sp. 427]
MLDAFANDTRKGPTDTDWAEDDNADRKMPESHYPGDVGVEKERAPGYDNDDKGRELESDDERAVQPAAKTIGGDEIRPAAQEGYPGGPTAYPSGPSGYPPEPPPEFSHYTAEKDVDDDGNTFSHDHHLNTDALFFGSHEETRTRHVTRTDSNGRHYTTTETYTETIQDFAFEIDITQCLLPEPRGPPVWVIGDREPAHRGGRKRQVDNTPYMVGDETSTTDLEAGKKAMKTRSTWRRMATDVEKGAADGRKDRRYNWGIPSWVLLPGETRGTEANLDNPNAREVFEGAVNTKLEGIDDVNLRPPSRSLRDWADEYVRSKRMLKEFIFVKEIYGWNWGSVEQALKTVIAANYSRMGTTGVTLRITRTEVSVRGDNKLSEMLSNLCWYLLLWVLLIYPLIIWPFKRFSPYGGGEWRVAGASFALTKWVHMPDSRPRQTTEEYQNEYNAQHPNLVAAPRQLTLKQTSKGVSQLIGMREGEWFARWKDTVGALVRQGHISYGPALTLPMNIHGDGIGYGLDGFK